MTAIKDIISTIEAFAPLNLQESYDNAGLICGNPDGDVSSALLTLDITEAVIDEAIREGHHLIISHHPLIFHGIKNLLPDNYVNRCLIKAIRHGLNLYSAHTNMDAVMQGVSGRMADKLGLVNREILQPNGETGMGIVGELPVPMKSPDFLQTVKERFHCGVIRHTAICKPEIRRVAVCGGSGAFLTQTAIARQADIYITGDYKYHDFFNAENKLIIADIGHYESEQYTKEIFYELVTKKLPNFAVQFSKVVTNPVHYL